MEQQKNPFDLVKATDLTDTQIAEYFVDLPHGGGLLQRVKPTSAMPMIIFGGKGSGKTHLMRYLSSALQRRRHGEDVQLQEGIAREGYLGIYFRCGGLNAHRFGDKGQSTEVWRDVFAYYMELWIGQLLLNTVLELNLHDGQTKLRAIAMESIKLLDVAPNQSPTTLADALEHFETLQRQADIAINNCSLTHTLNLEIKATPGRIVFGLPKILARHIPCLKNVIFLYLVDEFENLTEAQQRYINTLIREREFPATLKVGVRLYGLKTRATLSADEENREDSEFEALRLDEELRERPEQTQYAFAREVVAKRLCDAGYISSASIKQFDPSGHFEKLNEQRLLDDLLRARREGVAPALVKLEQKLQTGLRQELTPGIRSSKDIKEVIRLLMNEDNPILEHANVFLFYRAWSQKDNLLEAAQDIAEDAKSGFGARKSAHKTLLKYFRSDIVAQLLRESRRKQRYVGFDTFVKMSAGLPRGLLTILKHVFVWSIFYGEKPFRDGLISIQAQADGVAQAAEWFFTEARAPGLVGRQIRDAMTRLGQLLRDIRFSDKPSESSLSTFSADLTNASPEAIRILESANNWSMLVRVQGGQHDRNLGRVDEKYQIHPMLAPRWDLPIARRGALALTGGEIDSIFAPESPAQFDAVLKRRVAPMMAPRFGEETRQHKGGLFEGIDVHE